MIATKDYASDKDFVRRFRDGAIAIARRKRDECAALLATLPPPSFPMGPRLSSGGHFTGFFLWDTVFCAMWARHVQEDAPDLPLLPPLDNLYALAQPDGFIAKEYTARGGLAFLCDHPIAFAPPILSWAELVMRRENRAPAARLGRVFPILHRHHRACRARFRRPDGLYVGDPWGCGMDDIPRYPRGITEAEAAAMPGGIRLTIDCLGEECRNKWSWMHEHSDHLSWNRQAGWIDMSCQMAFDAYNLAEIADILGLADEVAALRKEHAELSEAINALCWDEATGFYHDFGPSGIMIRKSAAAFWAIISRVATGERLERMVSVIRDERCFNRPIPFPALSADDPDYEPETAYWRGAVWPSTNYALLRGLVECGYKDFAEDAARRYYNANAELFEKTGTIWENISPEQCDHVKERSGPDFCGWGAIAPLALPAEFGW
ncbi:MAG: hypothetical protein IJT64_00825 [Kiritimatiellae bacterium]|nr:hypothetical protein [Kiritimatiellia bacterium]